MAKEIALKLKITSDGQEKVISNLKGLEEELALLQEKIKTLDFGSASFIEATQNISKLRTKIDEVDKATEGIGAEKKFRALGDAINIITGSFQVASGALSLFITDEQSLEEVQKAEKAALDVLNVALGVNAINQALVESATLRSTIATKLNEAATKAASIATAAWNFVLSLNPVVAIAAGVAALTAGIYLLIRATETDTSAQAKNNAELEAQANLEKDLITEKRKAAVQLKQQLTILTDNVRTRALENKTLEDLKKTYPGLNAFIDKNNKLTAEGITFIKLQIAAEESRAAINKLNEKRLEAEIEKETAIQDLRANGPSLLNKAIAATNGFLTAEQIQLAQISDKYKKNTAGLDVLQGKYTKQLDDTTAALEPLIKKTDAQAKADENAGKSLQKNTQEVDKYLEALNNRIKLTENIARAIEKATGADLKYTTEILQKQTEVINQQEAFLKDRTERFKTAGEKFADELRDYLFKVIPDEKQAKTLFDNYEKLFEFIKDEVKSDDLDITKSIGWDEFVVKAETAYAGIGETLQNVNEESRKSFIEYFNTLGDRADKISDIFKKAGSDAASLLSTFAGRGKENIKDIIDIEEQIAALKKEAIDKGYTENKIEALSLAIIQDKFGISQKILENQVEQNQILERRKAFKAESEEYKKLTAQFDALVKVKEGYDNIAKSILDGVIKTNDFVKGLEQVSAASDKNLATIEKNSEAINAALDPSQLAGLQDYFEENAAQYEVIFNELINKSDDFLKKLGEGGIDAIFKGVAAGVKEIDNKTRPELEKLKNDLKQFGDAFAIVFKLKGGNPFGKLLDDIDKKLKKLPTAAEEAFATTINKVKDLVDKFATALNDISSRLGSVLQSQSSLYLEELEYRKDQTLATIGEANTGNLEQDKKIEAERLAVQKEYEKKRFDIEKQARIQELELTLANTLVSAAQAVVNALALPAPPPFPQIYAAILAGLTAAQVSIINDQIQFTKNKTYIGRTGGLVEGSSHDTYGGGVPTMLEGGEFILNKEAVRAYGDQIQSINTATGGKPMAIDDSRLIQAIASQNLSTKQPLKAYVLYNDIQDTTKLNNKIEKLARL